MRLVIILVALVLILTPGVYLLSRANASDKPPYVWKPIQARVTHYCWKEKAERRWKGKTALNQSARNELGVAVDPALIPYGSAIYIPGIGVRIADDTGGRCKSYGEKGEILIDVRWVDKTSQELRAKGSEPQTVYLLQDRE